ncbi:MAG TPA: carboxypeptidase regulatory-like domain-containing protein [Methanosarcinaceae archaeon]|nr:carboxypeptidase regulatory-like domain-containing protein [Methanosarcinaceae archaeon]
MHLKHLVPDERGSVGLPIRMVVLTIIGLVGFAAIVISISNAPTAPRPIYAVANVSTFELPGGTGDTPSLLVTVFDNDNNLISNANVVVRGPSRSTAAGGVTDYSGEIVIRITNISLPVGKQEGYLSVKVMADGYLDHTDAYTVKVVKT